MSGAVDQEGDDKRWVMKASCRGMDPDLFNPQPKDHLTQARAQMVCITCPVQTPCLAYAMKHRLDGVYAGTTTRERKLMRKSAPLSLFREPSRVS